MSVQVAFLSLSLHLRLFGRARRRDEIGTFEGSANWRMLVVKENAPCQPTN